MKEGKPSKYGAAIKGKPIKGTIKRTASGKAKSDEKTIVVRIPKSKKTPEQEAAQLKRDRQSVRMGAQTIGKIYPKDGSRGEGRAENKKIRDREAASVRANRKIMAKKAKKLAKAKP